MVGGIQFDVAAVVLGRFSTVATTLLAGSSGRRSSSGKTSGGE